VVTHRSDASPWGNEIGFSPYLPYLKFVSARFLLTTSLLLIGATGFSQQKKYALVIGAQQYQNLPPLRNALNDARMMFATLKAKGFEVNLLLDPKSRQEVKTAITAYYEQMRDVEGGVGIIFYAGHGIQYNGENYLIPTGATLNDPSDLDDYCVKMNTFMSILRTSSKSLNILLLDACRTLPSFTRGVEQGLSRMEAPQGSIIVFATQAGKVASDGTSSNGLFTSKLIAAMNEPNLNITEVFKRVKQQVYLESRESQLPSVEDNSIGGDFYFTSSPQAVVVTKPIVPAATSSAQTPDEKTREKLQSLLNKKAPDNANDAEVYSIVDEPPQPVGGFTEFSSYLNKNLQYPPLAKKNGIDGSVFVEFIVNENGSISNVKAIKGLGAGCDEEAVRLVSSSAAWIPGKHKGKIVRAKQVFPVRFKLR